MATIVIPEKDAERSNHLSEREIAAFIDHRLSSGALAAAEAHLASCPECRAELREARAMVASLPQGRTSPRSAWWIGLVAAAAILLVVLLPRADPPLSEGPVERRGGAGDAAARVATVAPADGAVVAAEGVRFIWRRNDDASYRITILDSAGGTLWSMATQDTMTSVPADVHLAPGARFYWYVDALRMDGTAAASEPSSFRTR